MKTDHTLLQENFNVPKRLERKFDEKTLKEMLRPFNQHRGGSYFFVDFYSKKMILDMPNEMVLCGQPKETLEEPGFDFLSKILNKKDLNWLNQMWKEYQKMFLKVDENKRKDFLLLYDLNVKMGGGCKRILHYKIVPYQLCNRGNLWLALVCVSQSLSTGENNACMLNLETKKRYDFKNNIFEESDIAMLNPYELSVLDMFARGMLESAVREQLEGMAHSTYHDLRGKLFKKLEVFTPAEAVLRAYQLGLI